MNNTQMYTQTNEFQRPMKHRISMIQSKDNSNETPSYYSQRFKKTKSKIYTAKFPGSPKHENTDRSNFKNEARSFANNVANTDAIKRHIKKNTTIAPRVHKTSITKRLSDITHLEKRKTSPDFSDSLAANKLLKKSTLEKTLSKKDKRLTMDSAIGIFAHHESGKRSVTTRNIDLHVNKMDSTTRSQVSNGKANYMKKTTSSAMKNNEKSVPKSTNLHQYLSPRCSKTKSGLSSTTKTRTTGPKFISKQQFSMKPKKSLSTIKTMNEVQKMEKDEDNEYLIQNKRKAMRSGERAFTNLPYTFDTKKRDKSKNSTCSQIASTDHTPKMTMVSQVYFKCDTFSGRQTDCTTQLKSRDGSKTRNEDSVNRLYENAKFNNSIKKPTKVPYYPLQSTKKLTEPVEFKFSERWSRKASKLSHTQSMLSGSPNYPFPSPDTKSIKHINDGVGKVNAFNYINENQNSANEDEGAYDFTTKIQCLDLLSKLKCLADQSEVKCYDEQFEKNRNMNLDKIQKEVEMMTDSDLAAILEPKECDSPKNWHEDVEEPRSRAILHESVGSLLSSFTSNMNTVTLSSLDGSDIFVDN